MQIRVSLSTACSLRLTELALSDIISTSHGTPWGIFHKPNNLNKIFSWVSFRWNECLVSHCASSDMQSVAWDGYLRHSEAWMAANFDAMAFLSRSFEGLPLGKSSKKSSFLIWNEFSVDVLVEWSCLVINGLFHFAHKILVLFLLCPIVFCLSFILPKHWCLFTFLP